MTGKAFPRISLAGRMLVLAALVPFGMQVHASESVPLSTEAARRGRALFTDTGCVQCHTLADAGSTGGAGPALDGNPHLTRALIVERVTRGQNDMPGFLGILTEEEIEHLADYLLHVTEAEGT